MTQQTINIGSAPNDGTGDTNRNAFNKCNLNFTELYGAVTFHSGRLEYVSATALSFKPYNGDRIKIAGAVYAIPSAGIAGLANTSVFVNGTGGQNLAASTVYYVYAFSNSGTVTADFSTTGHAVSSTAGNIGTEIKSGDNTRTLIGMIRTNSGSQFQHDGTYRGVISWFNRRNITIVGANTAGAGTSSLTAVEIATGARAFFLTWGEEDVLVGLYGTASNNVVGANTVTLVYLDNSMNLTSQNPSSQENNVSYFFLQSLMHAVTLAEGFHQFSPYGFVNVTCTALYYVLIQGMIRG